MTVFFDTGGGDIYGGQTREDVTAAMREDIGAEFDESAIVEVDGTDRIVESDEDDRPTGKLITLAEAFGDSELAYCIATDNC